MPRKPRVPRRRRDPETARTELLDAAERVFASHHPDDAGLKQVADEAGVSHALITHYFGTYRGLVEATLQRRLRALRARILDRMQDVRGDRPGELLAILFDALDDPVHLRLMRWYMGSERASSAEAFGLQDHGIQIVAAQLASVLLPQPPPPELVDKLELGIVAAVAAAYGYATGKHSLAHALGRPPSRALDAAVRDTLAGMVAAYLRAEILPKVSPAPGTSL